MSRGALVALVLGTSLLGGAVGGATATVVGRFVAAPSPATPAASSGDDAAAAANAVIPAVVTLLIPGGGRVGTGSGVVIDAAKGYVATNSHVVETSDPERPVSEVTVVLADGRSLNATVLGNDPRTDVALVKVDGRLPAQATLGLDPVPVGARVIAIGTPGVAGLAPSALTSSVTSGVVSAVGRRLPREGMPGVVFTDMIQTDATIGPGMSGGPLVLVSSRKVIGLNSVRIENQVSYTFAVSATTVKRVVEEILAAQK